MKVVSALKESSRSLTGKVTVMQERDGEDEIPLVLQDRFILKTTLSQQATFFIHRHWYKT